MGSHSRLSTSWWKEMFLHKDTRVWVTEALPVVLACLFPHTASNPPTGPVFADLPLRSLMECHENKSTFHYLQSDKGPWSPNHCSLRFLRFPRHRVIKTNQHLHAIRCYCWDNAKTPKAWPRMQCIPSGQNIHQNASTSRLFLVDKLSLLEPGDNHSVQPSHE